MSVDTRVLWIPTVVTLTNNYHYHSVMPALVIMINLHHITRMNTTQIGNTVAVRPPVHCYR